MPRTLAIIATLAVVAIAIMLAWGPVSVWLVTQSSEYQSDKLSCEIADSMEGVGGLVDPRDCWEKLEREYGTTR